MAAPTSGIPLRTAPKVLRVWVAPWIDDNGDLHDQSYFYTQVSSGAWTIEASRKRIIDDFKPVFPLGMQGKRGAEENNNSTKAPLDLKRASPPAAQPSAPGAKTQAPIGLPGAPGRAPAAPDDGSK
jgi:conjugal transfer pilus assembly protein TraV